MCINAPDNYCDFVLIACLDSAYSGDLLGGGQQGHDFFRIRSTGLRGCIGEKARGKKGSKDSRGGRWPSYTILRVLRHSISGCWHSSSRASGVSCRSCPGDIRSYFCNWSPTNKPLPAPTAPPITAPVPPPSSAPAPTPIPPPMSVPFSRVVTSGGYAAPGRVTDEAAPFSHCLSSVESTGMVKRLTPAWRSPSADHP
jgi:hypothetical protein